MEGKLLSKKIRPYFFLYAVSLGFLFGVGLANWLIVDLFWWYLGALIVVVIFFWNPKNKWLVVLVVFLISVFLGYGRLQLSQTEINASHIAFYIDQEVSFKGYVASEVSQRSNHQKIVVAAESILQQKVQGKVLVNTSLYPPYHYGQHLQIKAVLQRPEPFSGFAYDKYLAKDNIYAVAYYPEIKVLAKNKGNKFYSKILLLKEKLIKRVNELLPEPEASFLGGLLWGAKQAIPTEVLENFNASGTTHIVALSGYNITVLGLIIFFLCPWFGLGRKHAFWLVVGIIIFFVIITGYPASVVRAALMGGLVLVAYRWGGGVKPAILLLVSAAIMVAINPKVLFDDVGFQLSFLATIGLIYLQPIFSKYLKKIAWPFVITETISATSAAIVMTGPLIIYQFARFSLVALPANILVLFVIPFTMGLGFLAILTSFLFYPLGAVLSWLAYFPLHYVVKTTAYFAAWPYAQLEFGFDFIWLLVSYGLLIIFIFYFYKKDAVISKKS